jgi:hypothetical protein
LFGNMKAQVTAVIKSFEEGTIPDSAALAKLGELTGRTVDAGWLREYWRSESLEDFVDRLCAEPIPDWQAIMDPDALALIREYLRGPAPGRRDSIGSAIDRRYGKPGGTLMDLVFHKGLTDAASILDELKKDTRIYL